MKLHELLEAVETVRVEGIGDVEVTGVVGDSRTARPGNVFVALAGTKRRGGDYVADAVARGVVAVVSDDRTALAGMGGGVCRVHVADARYALGCLAAAFHGYPSRALSVVGITGTNGKTSVAFLTRDILRAAGRAPGLIGTVEYQIGGRSIPASRTTPDAPALQAMLAQMVSAGCRSVVMEVSSHALSQCRTQGTVFDVGVFTNLTRDHLDYHETMEAYFEAKARLFAGLGQDGKSAWAVINVDDEWARELVTRPMRAELLTYGLGTDAAVRAENVSFGWRHTTFNLVSPWGNRAITTALSGAYNVRNALAAIASCGALGVELDVIEQAIRQAEQVPGRLELVPCRKGPRVLVDYAHTDDALMNVLLALRPLTEGRLIVVFGCGGDRDRTKRPAMGRVAAALADHVVLTSDNPRSEDPAAIIEDIRRGVAPERPCDVEPDRRAAIALAISLARKGDVVLIAGKGHERFQEFANTTVPFDDRQVAAECLAEKS